jgi:hypothetical protein
MIVLFGVKTILTFDMLAHCGVRKPARKRADPVHVVLAKKIVMSPLRYDAPVTLAIYLASKSRR